MSPAWWNRGLLRVIQFNIEDPYGFYADAISAEDLVSLAKKAHANTLVVFARDAWGRVFYRGSRLYPRHRRARLDVAELVRAAKREGLRVVIMTDHTANRYIYRRHPGWAQRTRSGEVIVLEHYPVKEKVRDPQWPQICINSPAMESYFIPEAEEALKATDADGVLLDSFRYLPDPQRACYCRYCRLRFRLERGLDLPSVDDMEDEAFREAWEWRYHVIVDSIRRLRDTVKGTKEDAMFFYNSHPVGWAGRGTIVAERARDYLDAVFAEASETDVLTVMMLPMVTKLSQAAVGEGKPVLVSRNLFYNLRTVQSATPLAVKQGIRSIVASGGHPMATIFSSQYFEDSRAIDALAEVYEELERVEDKIVGSEPIRYMGILYSSETHEKVYWNAPHYYTSEIEGMAMIAFHRHLPYEFLSMKDIHKAGRYKVLVAAETDVLSDEEEAALEDYVERGGFLVVTHSLGRMYPDFTYRHSLAMEETLKVRYEGVFYFGYVFVDLEEAYSEYWDGLPKAVVLGDFSTAFTRERTEPRLGELVRARPVEGARVLAWGRLGRSAYGYEYTLGRSTPAPDSRLNMAAITLGGRGSGKTLYYSVRLGAHYSRLGHPDYAELLLRPLKREAPPPDAWSDAPDTVQTEFFRKGDTVGAHLVNLTFNERILSTITGPSKQSLPAYHPSYNVHPPRVLVPVGPFRVRLPRPDGERLNVYDALTGKGLDYVVDGDGVLVNIRALGEYMILIAEPRS
ncbi:hypothetical protein apy_14000 [Aeropyrum pernix]|uniref:Beta-galactosidase trimerisation domain-containing protein n=1 Tax=Aeropyrum pernix TaxID=56636 RepID=A0A401HB50_AERPX|nr:hypothetical protein [Aeropyrum pernix]GBF09675.1 hypothetical protein apy_14000 [Aeropyrum pernix]